MDAITVLSESYLALIREFPLRPLRSEADLDAAIAMTHKLIDKKGRDAGEEDYLEVLAGLIHAYEAEVDPLPELDPVAALRFLLETNGITQAQLAEETGLAMATISEILNGKRRISAKARESLAKRFKVCSSLFT